MVLAGREAAANRRMVQAAAQRRMVQAAAQRKREAAANRRVVHAADQRKMVQAAAQAKCLSGCICIADMIGCRVLAAQQVLCI